MFKPLDCSAIGNPASPVLSNILMNDLISSSFQQLGFRVPSVKKYIDDVVPVITSSKCNEILRGFKSSKKKLYLLLKKNRVIKFHCLTT